MKNIILYTLVVLTCYSCKKDKADPKEQLSGQWTVTQTAEDMNDNGQMDAAEVDSSFAGSIYLFNKDGSGNAALMFPTSVPITFSFQWSLINNNQDIQISSGKIGPYYYNTGTAHIESVATTNLVFKAPPDSNSEHITWSVMVKQN